MIVLAFSSVLERALEDGLVAAALVDRDGNTIALAGPISAEEAMPLAALAMYRLKSPDLSSRMFGGEVISVELEDRHVAVGVAKRQLFLVAIFDDANGASVERVRELRDEVGEMLVADTVDAGWTIARGQA
ncbi:MAG: hypothetical protein SFX73_01630 [Kofleriaceae bacterium]|nr:hypothetical protein [Kofleriaceae bacterium]